MTQILQSFTVVSDSSGSILKDGKRSQLSSVWLIRLTAEYPQDPAEDSHCEMEWSNIGFTNYKKLLKEKDDLTGGNC